MIAGRLFLGAVGTLPASQRRGLARRTLEPMLGHTDHDGLPCFLETSTQANVALYRCLGFDVIGHIRIEAGEFEVWAMLRPPTPER